MKVETAIKRALEAVDHFVTGAGGALDSLGSEGKRNMMQVVFKAKFKPDLPKRLRHPFECVAFGDKELIGQLARCREHLAKEWQEALDIAQLVDKEFSVYAVMEE